MAQDGSATHSGSFVVIGAVILRVSLLLWGAYQDATMPVKYTDIDYSVFTDASKYVYEGHSPYRRETYRYSPLLSWILLPTAFAPIFGKLLFVAADLATGFFIKKLVILPASPKLELIPASRSWADWWSALWLLNPFVAVISTRGNAESLVTALVMGSLLMLNHGRHKLAAVLLGISIHLKIYPVIYALPMWFAIRGLVPANSSAKESRFSWTISFFSRSRLEFGILAVSTFLGLGAIMFSIYGNEFLENSYLYHITRQDHRHNFSLYFYHLYLTFGTENTLTRLVAFVPQLALVAIVGGTARNDLPFACFAQTFAFVMLNKVVTSQYFMWYMCFLPIVMPFSMLVVFKRVRGFFLVVFWAAAQAFWLFYAYQLEHTSVNTFRVLYVAGCTFSLVNAVVITEIARNHSFPLKLKNK
ncbi:PIG-M-domain-containing protein [Zopfochytrium polystomum]|nr:PIG-M-domain-containing protein [Zopfochytrium polystomum]